MACQSRFKLDLSVLKSLLVQGSGIRCIVFVVDSATFGKKAKDVAELAYDVIYESSKRIPMLMACNKQDISIAKSSKVTSSKDLCGEHRLPQIPNKSFATALPTLPPYKFRF